MKSISLLIALPMFLFGLSNCGGAQVKSEMKDFAQNPPFKIVEAYFQKWVAGVEEGGSGTNVHLVFSDVDTDVVIQNIYFRNQKLEAKNNVNEPQHYVGYINNDTKKDVIMDSDAMKEAQNTPSKIIPFQLENNEAVVEYWFGGKRNYFKITKLSQKDMIPYPQSNPNSHE